VGAYTAFTSTGVNPEISVKFSLRPRIELSLMFGMQIAAESTFTPGARFAYVLIPEKNLNLFVAGAVGVDLRTTNGLNAVLARIGPGVEFFFTELPNLGFMAEFGFQGTVATKDAENNLGSSFGTTAGAAFGGGAIHYYF